MSVVYCTPEFETAQHPACSSCTCLLNQRTSASYFTWPALEATTGICTHGAGTLLLYSPNDGHSRSTMTSKMVMCKADLHLFSTCSLITVQVILQSLPYCLCRAGAEHPFLCHSGFDAATRCCASYMGSSRKQGTTVLSKGIQLRTPSTQVHSSNSDLMGTCAVSAHLLWLQHARP